jgi:hypothetical protein
MHNVVVGVDGCFATRSSKVPTTGAGLYLLMTAYRPPRCQPLCLGNISQPQHGMMPCYPLACHAGCRSQVLVLGQSFR